MLRLIHQLCLIALAIAAVSIAAAQTPTISSISPDLTDLLYQVEC